MLEQANTVVNFVPKKSDDERAKELRATMTAKLLELCDVMRGAMKDGLQVNFQLQRGPTGDMVIAKISILKEYGE